jgi:hypothetical protein
MNSTELEYYTEFAKKFWRFAVTIDLHFLNKAFTSMELIESAIVLQKTVADVVMYMLETGEVAGFTRELLETKFTLATDAANFAWCHSMQISFIGACEQASAELNELAMSIGSMPMLELVNNCTRAFARMIGELSVEINTHFCRCNVASLASVPKIPRDVAEAVAPQAFKAPAPLASVPKVAVATATKAVKAAPLASVPKVAAERAKNVIAAPLAYVPEVAETKVVETKIADAEDDAKAFSKEQAIKLSAIPHEQKCFHGIAPDVVISLKLWKNHRMIYYMNIGTKQECPYTVDGRFVDGSGCLLMKIKDENICVPYIVDGIYQWARRASAYDVVGSKKPGDRKPKPVAAPVTISKRPVDLSRIEPSQKTTTIVRYSKPIDIALWKDYAPIYYVFKDGKPSCPYTYDDCFIDATGCLLKRVKDDDVCVPAMRDGLYRWVLLVKEETPVETYKRSVAGSQRLR